MKHVIPSTRTHTVWAVGSSTWNRHTDPMGLRLWLGGHDVLTERQARDLAAAKGWRVYKRVVQVTDTDWYDDTNDRTDHITARQDEADQ